jgi:DNA-directed RNA polymerase specialized sigma subunit
MNQSEIAAQIGVSQVHVSRLLRLANERLRDVLERRTTDLIPSP